MHTQFEKCAYVRNHGHNNMRCGHAPHGGAYPHKSIPLHFQTYLFPYWHYGSTIIAHFDSQV